MFPPTIRDMKRRLDEVVRGVRWHRIAEPFGVGTGTFETDSVKLKDHWVLQDRETWNPSRAVGSVLSAEAPARVSRGMPLPEVSCTGEDRPFVLASRYPNGAVAIASIGRAMGRRYVSREVDVTMVAESVEAPVGVFGYFKNLTLVYRFFREAEGRNVYAQDLAGDEPVDITGSVKIEGSRLTIPGEVIRTIGLMKRFKG